MMGAMLDNYGLYERLSAYENLAFYADIYGISHAGIPDMLKSIGLYEARRTAVSKLSKGMKNRLSLARALMNHAKLLFLDEPTSGLDPVTTREIHDVLLEQRKQGTTVFLTTHNMATSVTVPVMMVFSFLPMLSLFNDKIEKIARFFYSEQISRMLSNVNSLELTAESIGVIGANILAALLLFAAAFRRCQL